MVYHGTSQADANQIVRNGVDVTSGGGELGQGFYLADQLAFAVAWARGRHGPTGKVVQFDVVNSDYARLNVLSVGRLRVCSTWVQLKLTRRTHSYLFGADVVYGPICSYPHLTQHKFESPSAGTLLDRSTPTVL